MDESQISIQFKRFANVECKGSSRLYEFLSMKISQDNEVLELCTEAQSGQPIPNLLLGAVHYLFLKGNKHKLKEYYPSIMNPARKIDDDFFVFFKDLCKAYRDEIVHILKTRLVQTNEIRRCAYLYPLFCMIYSKANKPLSLIEIGTSAGLQLLWDTYSYSYGSNEIYGNKNSNVHIHSESRGGDITPFLTDVPPVASKIGLDLHISDLKNTEDYLWLKALIWPEHQERLKLFENAAGNFKENPVELLEGDGVTLLPDIVAKIPKGRAVCIYHTHVANQMPVGVKNNLLDKVQSIGRKRDVFHLYNNMWDKNLHLDYYIDGVEYNQSIGATDGHGRWFEWNIEKFY